MKTPGPALERYRGRTVLAVGAHPDDIELGIGGTVARLQELGAKLVLVTVCVPNELERRLEEAENSASILGGQFKALFSDSCRRVEDIRGEDLREKLDRLISECEPSLLLAHGYSDFHLDHRLVHEACLESLRLSYFDFLCYCPTSCRRIPARFDPDAYVDISQTIERKIAAINAHPSQFQCRGLETDVFRRIAREQGEVAGVDYAEGLEIIRFRLD